MREKGLRTRQRILDAAADVFTREGYLNARVADIAQRARVAHGSFYTYFDSKDDVFRRLAENAHAGMCAAIADAEGAGAVRERLAFATIRYVEAYERHAAILGLIEQVAAFDERFRALRGELRGRLVDMLERVVGEAGPQGAGDLDPRVVARALAAIVEDFAHAWFVLGEPYERDAAMSALDGICARMLGVGPARPDSA